MLSFAHCQSRRHGRVRGIRHIEALYCTYPSPPPRSPLIHPCIVPGGGAGVGTVTLRLRGWMWLDKVVLLVQCCAFRIACIQGSTLYPVSCRALSFLQFQQWILIILRGEGPALQPCSPGQPGNRRRLAVNHSSTPRLDIQPECIPNTLKCGLNCVPIFKLKCELKCVELKCVKLN